MSRDQRLLLLLHRSGTWTESATAWSILAVSAEARKRYRRLEGVSAVLSASLADPEDLEAVRIPTRSKTLPRSSAAWILLGILAVVVFIEYRTYTIPVLLDALRQAAHKCGIP